MLRITPTNLHWLGPAPQHDLCAHGGIEVSIGGKPFVTGEDTDLAVSTGALHLLRTLQADHTPDVPIAEHLVPHCGHFMVLEERSGEVANVGCPFGINWWVRHENGMVVLAREDGAEERVAFSAWSRAVAEFADCVDAFISASPPREPSSEHDATWYRMLRAECARLRSAATIPPRE